MTPTTSIKMKNQSIPGSWVLPNLFVPTVLAEELAEHKLRMVPSALARLFPDQMLMVSSVLSSWNGRPRKKGTSHIEGLSVDLAPVASRHSVLKADGTSPNLCDNLRLATFLAAHAPALGAAIVLEDDHFHIDSRLAPGCYLYQSRHSEYAMQWSADPRLGRVFVVLPTGVVNETAFKLKY